jgi:hypothetical protein
MSPRRHSASSMVAAAMPLAELEQWLQARAGLHPVATSLPALDGYVAAIVAGPVSMGPLDWICPLLAIDADAFNHGDTPEFAAISAVALRHNEINNILSTAPRPVRADAPPQTQWRRRSATPVSGVLRRHAAQDVGVGAVARPQRHQSRLASAHPAALSGRSGPSAARTTTAGLRDQEISAQRPRRYSIGRRGHARQYWMPIRYARAG